MAQQIKPAIYEPKPGLLSSVFFTVFWYALHNGVNTVFQLSDVAAYLIRIVSSKIAVPESLEAKFTQVGAELESYKKTLGTLTKIPKHIAFAIMPEKYLDLTEENIASVDGDGDENGKPEDDNFKNHAMETTVNKIIVKSLAKEISWAYAANIGVVSLYDHQGLLRGAHTQLRDQIKFEIQQNINGILKTAKNQEHGFTTEVPVIKVFNADEHSEWLNDLQGEDVSTGKPILYIFIFSYDNGKEGVIDTIREVMKENKGTQLVSNNNNEILNNQRRKSSTGTAIQNIVNNLVEESNNKDNSETKTSSTARFLSEEIIPTSKDVPNESKMDSLINDHLLKVWQNKKLPSEPEVLIVHGDIKSTLGFLPWHIRLTEFSWISELKDVGLQEFTDVLIKYGHCNQKLGA